MTSRASDPPANPDADRCAKHALFKRIDDAFQAGDLATLKDALGNPPEFPNVSGPAGIGACLEYAIYHSPLPFIRTLLELGANPNYDDHLGFPALIAALSCLQVANHRRHTDVHEVMTLLLAFGADVHQRGVNDFTPLHYAAMLDDIAAVDLLLKHGADPTARTRIDDYETPLELADRAGKTRAAERLRNRDSAPRAR